MPYEPTNSAEANYKDKDYTIEQPNECKMKLNIPLSLVNDINQELKKDHETNGPITRNRTQ